MRLVHRGGQRGGEDPQATPVWWHPWWGGCYWRWRGSWVWWCKSHFNSHWSTFLHRNSHLLLWARRWDRRTRVAKTASICSVTDSHTGGGCAGRAQDQCGGVLSQLRWFGQSDGAALRDTTRRMSSWEVIRGKTQNTQEGRNIPFGPRVPRDCPRRWRVLL